MAIEPISSAMTYQVQSTPAAQPVKNVEKPASEYTEVSAQESAAQPVDNVTLTVASATEKDGQQDSANQNQQQNANPEKIKKAIEEMNKKMANSEAQFGIHEATNRVTIKIVDKQTKEVIKELPAEKTLDMIAKVWEMAGILVDEKR